MSSGKEQLRGIIAELAERLEDLSDTAELLEAQLRGEPTMSFEEHLRMFKETTLDAYVVE